MMKDYKILKIKEMETSIENIVTKICAPIKMIQKKINNRI